MILYLDTSAYVRLYIDEPGHELVAEAVQGADSVMAHVIGYAEMRAALARLQRTKRLSAGELVSIKQGIREGLARYDTRHGDGGP